MRTGAMEWRQNRFNEADETTLDRKTVSLPTACYSGVPQIFGYEIFGLLGRPFHRLL
jgi:hypothetical protein